MPRVTKNLNLQEVYIINCIDINMIDAMYWQSIEKENPVSYDQQSNDSHYWSDR